MNRIVILAIALMVIGCRDAEKPYITLTGNAQGTTFRIVYQDSLQRDFTEPVDSLFRLIDKSMSVWDSTSIISGFNRNQPGVQADLHFDRVFSRAQTISAATDGAFDITVGPLVRAWGFSYKKNLPPPDSLMIDSLLRLIGYDRVRLEDGVLIKADPAMEVDVNAIAQGYTVDLMAEFLGNMGIRNYMVEIGGEVRASGVNDQGAAWRIGIDKPGAEETPERELQAVVPLQGKALATSGSYRKFVERDGRRYSHMIDPLTGYPVQHSLLSVSVIAKDCTTADAFATAFMVLGLERAIEVAAREGLEIYAIYSDTENQLKVVSTPGFVVE